MAAGQPADRARRRGGGYETRAWQLTWTVPAFLDRHGQARTCDSLGYAHHHLGHHRLAIACYRKALTMVRYLGDRHQEAGTLHNLGDTHLATGDAKAACDAWQEALAILGELDHPDAEQVRTKLAALG